MFNSLQHGPFVAYQCDIYYHLGISFANLEMYDKSLEPLSKVPPCNYTLGYTDGE